MPEEGFEPRFHDPESCVLTNVDFSPCNGYVTDFAKKRPITANGA